MKWRSWGWGWVWWWGRAKEREGEREGRCVCPMNEVKRQETCEPVRKAISTGHPLAIGRKGSMQPLPLRGWRLQLAMDLQWYIKWSFCYSTISLFRYSAIALVFLVLMCLSLSYLPHSCCPFSFPMLEPSISASLVSSETISNSCAGEDTRHRTTRISGQTSNGPLQI